MNSKQNMTIFKLIIFSVVSILMIDAINSDRSTLLYSNKNICINNFNEIMYINQYTSLETISQNKTKVRETLDRIISLRDKKEKYLHLIPKCMYGSRVMRIRNGMTFDTVLRDTPDELRPPSLILFDGFLSCPNAEKKIQFIETAERKLPSIERLMIFKYDIDLYNIKPFYNLTPEMDLAKRFNITHCPTLVFVSNECNGWIKWCTQTINNISYLGCKDFIDHCSSKNLKYYYPNVESDDSNDLVDSWVKWVYSNIYKYKTPAISPVLKTYKEQGRILAFRQSWTELNEFLNYYIPLAIKSYTLEGIKLMDMPKNIYEYVFNYYKSNQNNREYEVWFGQTNQSFHEKAMTFVNIRNTINQDLMDEYIKPILEEWAGVKLVQTSLYGIREYHPGSWLNFHIDKFNTHIISVTFCLAKLNPDTFEILEDGQYEDWPIEFVTKDGRIARVNQKPGQMILYESSKVMHGRISKNPNNIHAGFFLHYQPLNYDEELEKLRRIVDTNIREKYLSKESQEPLNPRLSQKPYLEHMTIE